MTDTIKKSKWLTQAEILEWMSKGWDFQSAPYRLVQELPRYLASDQWPKVHRLHSGIAKALINKGAIVRIKEGKRQRARYVTAIEARFILDRVTDKGRSGDGEK